LGAARFVTFCPTELNPFSFGLCAPLPFIDGVIDFAKVKSIAPPFFYVNAYNIDEMKMDDFTKDEITADHIRAALAFPFIYGPFKLNGKRYYEGAVVDCVNYKDVTEKHPGLETLVVLDVLGAPALIRTPRNLYDSWVLSMIIPLVATAPSSSCSNTMAATTGSATAESATCSRSTMTFPRRIWSKRLTGRVPTPAGSSKIGYTAGLAFCDEHRVELGLGRTQHSTQPPSRPPAKRVRRAEAPPDDDHASEQPPAAAGD
jgi:NTE family protein